MSHVSGRNDDARDAATPVNRVEVGRGRGSRMRLDSIDVVNFRGFERFKLDLHPEFTLLVGGSGSGKTALIDALAIAARHFVPDAVGPGVELSDLRRRLVDVAGVPTLEAQQPAVVSGHGVLDG